MLVAAKIGGELAARIGQPAVLGELLAGVVLGGSVLGVVPHDGGTAEVVHVLAELGVALLLFEIGLETDLAAMLRVGPASLAVATVGVVVPFALGFLFWRAFGVAGPEGDLTLAAVFIGATLTATSVGITARVLGDLGAMKGIEARIILGAAVIDDVMGLVILSVVSGVAAGGAVTALGVLRTLAVAAGFIVVAVVVGRLAARPLFDVVQRMRAGHALVVGAFAFALALAGAAGVAGSAVIIGAFAAGLVLSGTNQFDTIVDEMRPVAAVFTPFFFVNVGAQADVSLLDPSRPGASATLLLAGGLIAVAIAGKLVAGWAAPWVRYRRTLVGVGMIPRGEVGLIFAEIGRRAGLLTDAVFGAVLLTVMVTTFVAPPALKLLVARATPLTEDPTRAAS